MQENRFHADNKTVVPKEMVVFNDLETELAIQCELISAAICHQMNWDFLRRKIRNKAKKDSRCWNFSRLKTIDAADIDELLEGYPKKDRYLSKQRAEMLRELSSLSLGTNETLAQVMDAYSGQDNIEDKILTLLNSVSLFSDILFLSE